MQLADTQGAFYPRFSTQRFGDYLSELEVPAATRFEAMSLGQKKVAIAFGLATGTPLLLMDEPTNGLDIVGRGQFRHLMQRPEHADRVVLISNHQAHDLESILSHIWFIDQGRLVLSARMADLSRWLHMGVVSSAHELEAIGGIVFQEPIGGQTAYVAARGAQGPVQLELLYKALSLGRDALLAALPTGAKELA